MEYLYWLQNIRESCPNLINTIFVYLSEFVTTGAPLVIMVIMLCIDRKQGYKMGLSFGIGEVVNGIVKLTACIYRPWIQDSRLHVAKAAESSATGYSFPSGHTTAATEFYGQLAIWFKKNWAKVLMVALIVLTAFSRNWLGAHTFKDVAVAILENVIVIFLVCKLADYLDRNPSKDILVTVILLAFCAVALVYIQLKSYPIDLTEDGSILVDPYIMMRDMWKDSGMFIGTLLGWILNRRLASFRVEGSASRRILRALIGVAIFMAFNKGLEPVLQSAMQVNVGSFIGRCISFFWIYGAYPLLVGLVQKKSKAGVSSAA